MRTLVLAMALALPLPVLAGSTSVQTMNWQQDGARLALRSTEGQVEVEAASPEARFGVRRGDRIVRVDDTPVRQIDQLAAVLRQADAAGKAQVFLLLRRNGQTLSVPVAVAPWKTVLVPPPAPPPPPPPPPR
ncbi:PDZ domain-containing protein [Stenotrophomonas sp.]|uniref:PDZ domain-containing protein n=1 Tax=Stenotrophomonas sp. TaxID=69392 RepID=UPI002D6250D1|nr:PDZ domain-containing protein [Stenotrophomonas sp.]HYQ25074.1 PDZ domain-containing protein [Stenotrophomonas sp.]